MDTRQLDQIGLTEQDRVFSQWSNQALLEKARQVPQMSNEKDDMGFSEQDSWWEAMYRQVRGRRAAHQEYYDHSRPGADLSELDAEDDILLSAYNILKKCQ